MEKRLQINFFSCQNVSVENDFLGILFFSDPPEITGEQSYIQDGLEGIIKLELVCIGTKIHAL